MEQLTTTSILALFETNKEQRRSFIEHTIKAIEEGQTNPLKIHLQLKAMEEIISGMTSLDTRKNKNADLAKRYRDALLSESEKNGREFEYHNAKFTIRETGSKYDYSVCQDEELDKLQQQSDELNKKIKARQAFLKNIPDEGTTILDKETGDVKTIYRPNKTSTTSVIATLK